MTPKELAIKAAEILDKKKAEDIKVIEVTEQTIVAAFDASASPQPMFTNTSLSVGLSHAEKAISARVKTRRPHRRPRNRLGAAGLRRSACTRI